MFLRLCGPPSIPLSFIVADVLPRWMAYRFRLATDSVSPAVSHHRLRRGIPGYLILFYPHAFVPQRQLRSSELPSQSEFFVISKHFTATPRIPPTLCVLKETSSRCSADVERLHFTTRLISGLRSL